MATLVDEAILIQSGWACIGNGPENTPVASGHIHSNSGERYIKYVWQEKVAVFLPSGSTREPPC
jgi:hypothetical protein